MPPSAIQTQVIATRRSGQVPSRVEALEILRMAKGHAVWTVEGRPVLVKEHDVIFILPGQIFGGVESSESVPLRVERVQVRLPRSSEGERPGDLGEALGIELSAARLLWEKMSHRQPPKVQGGREIARLCQDLVHEGEPRTPLEGCHQKAEVFALLTRLCLALDSQSAKSLPAAAAMSEQRVAEFLQELEERSAEPWTLEMMAQEAGLKRSRFGSLCRQLTGENPVTFLSRLRVRASRRLLRETALSITEIAMECGFGSSQYFSKIFRRYQGHEPTHFRHLSAETGRGRGIHYLKSDHARTTAYATQKAGMGDFRVECRLTLDRLGGTAASFEMGPDRFGFDGRRGCFFCEGGTFGEARFYAPTQQHLREGVPFEFKAERKNAEISFCINGHCIALVRDAPGRRVGLVGLRPLRNGITIHSFRINGREAALKRVDQAE